MSPLNNLGKCVLRGSLLIFLSRELILTGQNSAGTATQKLYLLAATPTPMQDIGFPAELYDLNSGGHPQLVREVASAPGGVDSILVNYEERVISVASPRVKPTSFQIIRMDDSGKPEVHAIAYQGSGFDEHLLLLPGHRLIQSIVNVESPLATVPVPGNSPLPLPKAAPLEIPARAIRTTHLLGIDLSPGAPNGSIELGPSDFKYVTYAGCAGGAISRAEYLSVDGPSNGRSLEMRASGALGAALNIELPPALNVTPKDLIMYHVVSDSVVALSIKWAVGLKNIRGLTDLNIYDRQNRAWSEVALPGDASIIRGFGPWIAAVIAEDNRKTPGRTSPGEKNRRLEFARTGDTPDLRFKLVGRYFPGQLFIYNAVTHGRFSIQTGEGDSEVLLVSGSSIYYRVNDRLYQAELTQQGVGQPLLLAEDDVIRDVHWCFLSAR